MFFIQGIRVSEGISYGTLMFYKRELYNVNKGQVEDEKKELTRFQNAVESAMGELQVLYEGSVAKVGQENAILFGVHQMLLEDAEFIEDVEAMIANEKVNAEYAICTVSRKYEELLRKQKRAEDMRDVTERLLRILTKQEQERFFAQKEILLVADDLLPSETIQLDPKKVRGIILMEGTPTSHTVIFAKAMGIPIVIQAEMVGMEEMQGKFAVLNASEGNLYVSPDENVLADAKEKQRAYEEYRLNMCEKSVGKGKPRLLANIGSLEEVGAVLACGAEGIGLVRSESFCLREGRMLTEEEQFAIYKEIAQKMGQKRVVIRTWDFGEDKQIDGWPVVEQRGVQWCLENESIFKAQLRAILRASIYGNLAILLPMVTSLQDVKRAKALIDQVKKELDMEKVPVDREIPIGAMIETPAAVIESRELAQNVDFLSVGTNDLLQYTFARSRREFQKENFYEQYYPTIFKILQTIVQNVHAEGKKVSICGELAADGTLTKDFIKLEIDELSMAVNSIFSVKEIMIK